MGHQKSWKTKIAIFLLTTASAWIFIRSPKETIRPKSTETYAINNRSNKNPNPFQVPIQMNPKVANNSLKEPMKIFLQDLPEWLNSKNYGTYLTDEARSICVSIRELTAEPDDSDEEQSASETLINLFSNRFSANITNRYLVSPQEAADLFSELAAATRALPR